jgi:hypothetical protein
MGARRRRLSQWLLFASIAGGLPCGRCALAQQNVQDKQGEERKSEAETGPADKNKRVELNLVGKTDTAAGESRRNENIYFNPVDNNALKELNVRLGTTATVVGEFTPARNYFGAEFGNAPSAVLAVPAAPGAGFHGRMYVSHLNSVFSARSFFQVGDVKPAHENDYGFALGTPLWKGSRLMLEGNELRSRGSVNGNVLVPKPDERTPLTTDPTARAIVTRFLDAYPSELPNRTDINPRALNTNSPQSVDTNYGSIRLDQDVSSRDRLYLQYSFTSQGIDAFELVAGQNPITDNKFHTARISWNREWSATTLTDFSFGFDRLRSQLRPSENAVGPTVSTSGLETLGPQGNIPIDRAHNLFRYAGQILHIKGPHTLNAGFGLMRRQFNGIETDAHRGFFSFANDFGRDAITNLRLGLPSQFIVSIGNVHRGFRNWDMNFYAGDVVKVRRELTLNFGIRYEPSPSPYEVNGLNEIPYDCDCNNFAPQVGLAYQLPGRWGVARAGYGLQYGQIFPVTFQQVRFSPPGSVKIVVMAPDLSDPMRGLTQTGQIPDARPNLYLLDPELAVPYAHQYNLAWEPNWSRVLRVQFGYVGSRSHKLLIMWYLNRAHAVPGIPQTTATINDRRADPYHAEHRWVLNGSDGYFDAARASLVMPQWHGLSANVSYWFSKALDLGSNYTNTAYDNDSRVSRSQSEFETHRDMKGLSSFDQTHALLCAVDYRLPLMPGASWVHRLTSGWEVSAVALAKTGMPFTVVSGSDAPGYGNVDGNGNDRANLLNASVLGRTVGDPDTSRALLPRSAFGFMQPTDESGNLGRNTFRKGGIRNVNAMLSKTWGFGSEMKLTIRAESINLFNTPQFAEPGMELANGNFGQITNTLNDGRTFRFGAQFTW